MSIWPQATWTTPLRSRRMPLAEARLAHHAVDALAQARGHDTQVVDGLAERPREIFSSQLEHRHAESLGDRVEMALQREARLGRPVAALGAARRLVGQDAYALPAVVG